MHITYSFTLVARATQENFVKFDWPIQILRRKKILKLILKLKIFNNDFFGKLSPWKLFLSGNGP